MKQFALLAAVILFAVACQNAADTKDETKATETKTPTAGMFAANYSNAFEMGDMALADKAVLHSWKNCIMGRWHHFYRNKRQPHQRMEKSKS